MAIISEKDQVILNDYAVTVQREGANFRGFAPTANATVEEVAADYRQFMLAIDEGFLNPPDAVNAAIKYFEAERSLKSDLSAAVAIPYGTGPFPILVHVHGHGLRAGHPKYYEPWMRLIASYGIVVVFPNYRLQPEFTLEDQVGDMLYAIQWTKDNASELNGDINRMIIGGDSSGAALAFDILMRELEEPNGHRFGAYACADGQMNGQMAEQLMAKITPETQLPPQYLLAGSGDTNAGQPVTRYALKLMEMRQHFQMDVPYSMPHDFIKMAQLDAAQEANRRMCEFLLSAV